jgi:RNA polymerase sigma factor (TIGR02999 family)
MAGDSAANVTEVLDAVRTGRQGAAAALMGLVYDELRRLAHMQMAHVPPGATLEPTALVHEAYVRLVGRDSDEAWESRAHFFRTAARAMRDILVEQARRQASLKRGGDRRRVPLQDDQLVSANSGPLDVLELDEALQELQEMDPTGAQLAMLRYFAGLTVEECARTLDLAPATAKRRWRYTMAWLHRRMCGDEGVNDDAR